MESENEAGEEDGTAGAGEAATRDTEPTGRPCPACGEAMYERHCKYVCPHHGVVYDCSDTFY